MQPTLIRSFVHELEKQAVNFNTLKSYLAARAVQGVGGASALSKSLAGSGARTSREALQSMDALQKNRLRGIVEGGQLHRRMQRVPEQAGLGPTAQATRQRVEEAVRSETAGAPTRAGGIPLSKHYEGYMTPAQTSYSPKHIEKVMGLQPGQHVQKPGPTKLMGANPPTQSGSQSVSEATVPSRPSLPPHMVPTVRPPSRRVSVA